MNSRLLIIGGSDAGISAALRARELEAGAEIGVILADAFPNFSICGLPFYLSGEIADWHALAHRTRDDIERLGIVLHTDETAVGIDPTGKRVTTQHRSGQTNSYSYDRLIIGTGAAPVRPPIAGVDLPNVFFLHTMEESLELQRRLDASAESAVIVGGGYIGLEMADALRHRGLAVTLIEQLPSVMRTVDEPIAHRVEALLRSNGVDVRTGVAVTSISQHGATLQLHCNDGSHVEGDLVLVVVGVRPQTALARSAGVNTDPRGAILVDRAMRTNVADIWAAGDCVTTWHRLLQRDVYLPLGTTSHKQGRIAGENALGGDRQFSGSLGTQSVKLFNRVIAATGLREEEARANQFNPLAIEVTTWDHKAYYPGATELVVRLVGDRDTGLLLGGQLFGSYGSEVSKRIDTLATSIHQRLSVDALNDLDLSYTPPLSSPWDPLQMAAQAWLAAYRG